MTGFSDPDNTSEPGDKPAVEPMSPDVPQHPDEGDAEGVELDANGDEVPRGQWGPTADFGGK